jgi:outer membrane protein assembly factor BamB
MPPGVFTRSYDNSRTGANTHETVLTPSNVGHLKKHFSLTVTGDKRLEAQPLIAPAVTLADGSVRDVVYVCTMDNKVWAFNAHNGHTLWHQPVTLGRPVDGNASFDSKRINPKWGILSTPVVDPDTSTLYLVNWSSPDGTQAKASHRLHALSLVDGSPRHAPLAIGGSVAGTPSQFHTTRQKQRSALLLAQPSAGWPRKTLFVASGVTQEHDDPSLHGWVLAFDATDFRHTAAWATTPTGQMSGIWQGAQGPAADNGGHVYVMTSNGTWDGQHNFSESFVKLAYTPPASAGAPGSLQVADWFTPFLDSERGPGFDDQDLGSGGPVIATGMDLVVGAGKDGVLYVLDRNHFAKRDLTKLKFNPIFFTYFPGFAGNPANVHELDFLFEGKNHHLHGSPVFWSSPDHGPMLFNWGENENLRAWTIAASGVVTFQAKSLEVASAGAPPPGGMPGGMLTLSANGAQPHTGIVWATAPIHGDANAQAVAGILRAYDATQFGPANPDTTPNLRLLWKSDQLPGNHFTFSKFCPPVVWDGKVYTTTYDGRVDVYGL